MCPIAEGEGSLVDIAQAISIRQGISIFADTEDDATKICVLIKEVRNNKRNGTIDFSLKGREFWKALTNDGQPIKKVSIVAGQIQDIVYPNPSGKGIKSINLSL